MPGQPTRASGEDETPTGKIQTNTRLTAECRHMLRTLAQRWALQYHMPEMTLGEVIERLARMEYVKGSRQDDDDGNLKEDNHG